MLLYGIVTNMAKKILKSDLSISGIKALQKQLQDYQNSLTNKCELLVKRLAEAGIPVIDENMAKSAFTVDEKGIQSGADPQHYTQVKINTFGNYARADLIVEGKELLFIEFGAGVYYNGAAGTSPHPKGEEFGYVIGSYGKGHGIQKVWCYYANSGELILTHGVEATMPMYKASLEIAQNIVKIAKGVFK